MVTTTTNLNLTERVMGYVNEERKLGGLLDNQHTGQTMQFPGDAQTEVPKQTGMQNQNRQNPKQTGNLSQSQQSGFFAGTVPHKEKTKLTLKEKEELAGNLLKILKNENLFYGVYSNYLQQKGVVYDSLNDEEKRNHFDGFVNEFINYGKSNDITITFNKAAQDKMYNFVNDRLNEDSIINKISDGILTKKEIDGMTSEQLRFYNLLEFDEPSKKTKEIIDDIQDKYKQNQKEMQERIKLFSKKPEAEVQEVQEEVIEETSRFNHRDSFHKGTFNFMLKYGVDPDLIYNALDTDKKESEGDLIKRGLSVTQIAIINEMQQDKKGIHYINREQIESWQKASVMSVSEFCDEYPFIDITGYGVKFTPGTERMLKNIYESLDISNKKLTEELFLKIVYKMLEDAEKGEKIVGKYPPDLVNLVGLMNKNSNGAYFMTGKDVKEYTERVENHWAALRGNKKLEDSQIVEQVVEDKIVKTINKEQPPPATPDGNVVVEEPEIVEEPKEQKKEEKKIEEQKFDIGSLKKEARENQKPKERRKRKGDKSITTTKMDKQKQEQDITKMEFEKMEAKQISDFIKNLEKEKIKLLTETQIDNIVMVVEKDKKLSKDEKLEIYNKIY
jgi:hypothetical protein